MGDTITAAGHCGKNRVMGSSVRSHLVAGGAVAGAGIVALSLVVAPPRLDSARADIQAMRLAAAVSASEAPPGALLAKRIYDQARIVLPAAAFVGRDIADVVTGAATIPLTIAPAADGKQTDNTALASAAPAGIDLGAILGPLINNPIVGPIVLVGAIFFGVLVVTDRVKKALSGGHDDAGE